MFLTNELKSLGQLLEANGPLALRDERLVMLREVGSERATNQLGRGSDFSSVRRNSPPLPTKGRTTAGAVVFDDARSLHCSQ